MKITENFSVSEFLCPQEGFPQDLMDNLYFLCTQLEIIRAELGGRPIHVISGYRSPSYNRKIKGAPKSQHQYAKAADIKVMGLEPHLVHATILRLIKEGRLHNGGVGLYKTFCHFDTRSRPARWYSRDAQKG